MISIVLPTYNEKKNISIFIPKIESFLKKNKLDFEIIVVDDNSPDGTFELSMKLNEKYGNIRTVVRKNERGLGSALRDGYNLAKGDIIVSSDTDLSFEVEDMLRLINKIKEGYDIVVGSRHLNKKDYEKDKLAIKIKWMVSFFGNKTVSFISGINIHDFSANFRAIRTDVWKTIKTKENSNAILAEMIIRAKYKGFKIGEVPVTFKDRIYGQPKLNLIKEAPKFFIKFILIILESRLFR